MFEKSESDNYYYYCKLYNITTLVAMCRIDSFRLRGTRRMCLFLLNVEFSNACRFRVFQCHFSTVSCFLFPCFQLPQCWHGSTEYWKLPAFLPHIQNVVTNFSCWQCLCTLLGPISLLYKQLLQYTLLNLSLYTIRFINQISKGVPYETLSIRYHFYKIVNENTFALTLPCFIWVSRAIAKHARIVLTVFLSMFKFRCKRHYRNLATYSWFTTWREHVTKTAPARRRHSVGGGGGAAAAAHSSSRNARKDESWLLSMFFESW